MHAKIIGEYILWVMSVHWYNLFGGPVISVLKVYLGHMKTQQVH